MHVLMSGKRLICLLKVSFTEGSLARRMTLETLISGITAVSLRMVFAIESEASALRKRLDTLYILRGTPETGHSLSVEKRGDDTVLWHQRLGHMSQKKIS